PCGRARLAARLAVAQHPRAHRLPHRLKGVCVDDGLVPSADPLPARVPHLAEVDAVVQRVSHAVSVLAHARSDVRERVPGDAQAEYVTNAVRLLRIDEQHVAVGTAHVLAAVAPRGQSVGVVAPVAQQLPGSHHAGLDSLVLLAREEYAEVEHRVALGGRGIAGVAHRVEARAALKDLSNAPIGEFGIATPPVDL